MMASWIEGANEAGCHFPVQNLPFGVFSTGDSAPRCGVAIGEFILDLAVLEQAGLLALAGGTNTFAQPTLNSFMGLGPDAWNSVRARLTDLLSVSGDPTFNDDPSARERCLIAQREATLHLPFQVSEYTDFYAGRQHAENFGTMFRGPEKALPPNWLHIPIGYNGRASTVVVSGTDIRRPLGQVRPKGADVPEFGPCRRLDIELEMGAVVGLPSPMGEPVSVAEADHMIFGYVLLNDWSARDIQAWEYQPLGPFQSKAFATSISPWVVTKAALEPFRTSTPERDKDLPPYLREPGPTNYDIELEVLMQPNGAEHAETIARTNFRHMYYSSAQQLAHHSVCGCKMNTGDLLGSGTISGPEKSQYGSLLELTWGGRDPLTLESGATRAFIEDGDTLILTGWAQGEDYRIGFGECVGTVTPAPSFPAA